MRFWWLLAMMTFPAIGLAQSKTPAKKSRSAKLTAQSRLYGNQEPGGMQKVLKVVKVPKSKQGARSFNWSRECGVYEQSYHRATICVLEDGRIFGGIPPNIDENDTIRVYLIVRSWLSHLYHLRIAPANMVDVTVDTRTVSMDNVNPTKKAQFVVKSFKFGPFPKGAVELHVRRPGIGPSGAAFGSVRIRYQIPINGLSLFDVGVGLLGITPLIPQYTLITERGSSIQRIGLQDEGPIGLDVIILAKLYSWQFWDRKLFAGRDVGKTPTFIQRFNINVGFSLRDLLRSFHLGLGFELSKGFDLIGGVNFRIEERLTGGYQVGNPFQGLIDEIPKVRTFQVGFYFGLSLSTSVFSGLFTQLQQQSGLVRR